MKLLVRIYIGVVILVILFILLILFLPWSAVAQTPSPTATLTITPSSQQLQQPDWTSSCLTGLIWPIAFVFLSMALKTLVSLTDIRADGPRKFRARCVDIDQKPYIMTQIDVKQLKKLLNSENEVKDIELLTPNILESFDVGVELCVAAISTDLAMMMAFSYANLQNSSKYSTVLPLTALIGHIILAAIVVLLLGLFSNSNVQWQRIAVTQIGNFLGLFAVLISFLIFGSLVAI